ncbi:MAG: hypothetical protein WA081_09895 [Desulfosalsimonadaceae bacterium]
MTKYVKSRWTRLAILAAIICLVAAGYLLMRGTGEPDRNPQDGIRATAEKIPAVADKTETIWKDGSAQKQMENAKNNAGEGEAFPTSDSDMIAYMRNEFGNTIFHAHTQIRAIEKILAYLKNQYPDDWETRIYDFLKSMFPDMADKLFEQYNNLTQYNEWLKGNRDQMMGMSGKDRNNALWDTRFQVFGDDAYVIWENALKNELITDTLNSIAESKDTGIDEKLDMYVTTIRNAYEDKADRFISRRQTELMNKFLSLETVQENLHALPLEERREKLVNLRKAMGLDEEAVKRWDDLDAQRDKTWDSGRQYMAEREAILSKYEGEEQEQKLKELQAGRFSAEELEMIRSEEASGFYRYGHQRAYGKE